MGRAAAQHPLLTPSEELHCARMVQQWLNHPDGPEACPKPIRRRGERARQRLIAGNIRLVCGIAKKWGYGIERSQGRVDLDDLIQEGCLGLNKAAEKFDPESGYKFSTYAYWWVMQAVRRYLEKRSWSLTVTGNSAGDLVAMEKKAAELRDKNIPVTRETIYEAFKGKWTKYRIDGIFLFLERRYAVSLDQQLKEEGTERSEVVAAPEQPLPNEEALVILRVLREFNKDLWAALELEHVEGYSSGEISQAMGHGFYGGYKKQANEFLKQFGDHYDYEIRQCLAA